MKQLNQGVNSRCHSAPPSIFSQSLAAAKEPKVVDNLDCQVAF